MSACTLPSMVSQSNGHHNRHTQLSSSALSNQHMASDSERVSSILDRLSRLTDNKHNGNVTVNDQYNSHVVKARQSKSNVRRARVRPQSMYELTTDNTRKTVTFSDTPQRNSSVTPQRNAHVTVTPQRNASVTPRRNGRVVCESRPRLRLVQDSVTGEWSVVRAGTNRSTGTNSTGTQGDLINEQEYTAYQCYTAEMAKHVQQCRQELRVALDKALQTFSMLSDDQQLSEVDRQSLQSTLLQSFDEAHGRLENVPHTNTDTENNYYNHNNTNQSFTTSNHNLSNMTLQRNAQAPAVAPAQAEQFLNQFSDQLVELIQHKMNASK